MSKQTTLSSLGRGNPATESPPRTGVIKDGKVFTGSYDRDAWNKLSRSEKDQVISSRNGSSSNGSTGKKKHGRKVKALEKKLKQASRKLDETSRQLSVVLGKRNADGDSDASSVSSAGGANAGTQFGGQSSRTD